MRRVPFLDGLRAFAVLAVIGVHLNLLRGGGIGVDVFFVLSGFLITRLLLMEFDAAGRVDVRRFYLRRALRLLPALVVVGLVCGAAVLVVPTLAPLRGDTWRGLPVVLFYFENWYRILTGHIRPWLLAQSWSLSVEEQFYIVWPAVLLILASRFSKRRLPIGVGALLAVQILYLADATSRGWGWWRLYSGTDTDSFALLIGALLASTERAGMFSGGARSRAVAAWAGSTILVVIVAASPSQGAAFATVVQFAGSLATALVIWALLRGPVGALSWALECAPLQWIGARSYGIYLWHYPIIMGAEFAGLPHGAVVVLSPLLALAAAAASYRHVEGRFLRLKEQLRERAHGAALSRAVAHP